jgi:hypothetical protein
MPLRPTFRPLCQTHRQLSLGFTGYLAPVFPTFFRTTSPAYRTPLPL